MLSQSNYRILDELEENSGLPTRLVAQRAWTSCDRRGSAACRQELLWLHREGYVRTLDNEKPVCWVRTPKGSETVNKAIENYDFRPWRLDPRNPDRQPSTTLNTDERHEAGQAGRADDHPERLL